MPPHPSDSLTYILPILIIVPIVFLRIWRSMKPSALKLNRLWIRPAILIVIATLVLVAPLPGASALTVTDGMWVAAAGLLGAAAGWFWGRTTQLHLHPENGTLM